MFLSDGATHTSPTETVVSRSNWCSKVTPLLEVLSNPPEAVATQNVVGSASNTEKATIRPPIEAGPMQRHDRALVQLAGRLGSNVLVFEGIGAGAFFSDSRRLVRSAICFSISATC